MKGMEFFIKHPDWIFIIFGGVFLFAGLVNYHSATLRQECIKVEGEVCNVESERVVKRRSIVTRYNYDVVWYMEGEQYIEHFERQINYRKPGKREIWVNLYDNSVSFSSADQIKTEVPKDFWIAALCGVLGGIIRLIRCLLRKETREQKIDRLENNKIYSGIAMVLAVFGIFIVGIDLFKEFREKGVIDWLLVDLLVAIIIILLIALFVFLRAKKELKKY